MKQSAVQMPPVLRQHIVSHQFSDSQQSHQKIKIFLQKLGNNINEEALSMKKQQSIRPQLPPVTQNATIHLPEGKSVQLPILTGTDGV